MYKCRDVELNLVVFQVERGELSLFYKLPSLEVINEYQKLRAEFLKNNVRYCFDELIPECFSNNKKMIYVKNITCNSKPSKYVNRQLHNHRPMHTFSFINKINKRRINE